MESKIIILPPDLVSKIAAGEVIDRPTSCIKELIENSIDAQASRISCAIKGNGVQEMIVADDGMGMTLDELKLSVQPHTTSKLIDEAGLYKIMNFGFRGEALPSICRVAEVEITSRTKEQGGYIKVIDEQIIEARDSARAIGTTVTVRNLFYNLPARRKFLKSSATELRYITQVIHRLALSYPHISFSLTHDEHEILNLPQPRRNGISASPQQDLAQRIAELFGSEFLNSLAFIKYEESGMQVSGYLSKPYNISTLPEQFIFINNRPCRDRTVRRAIEQAYGVPLKEKSPSYMFFAYLPPEWLDVNVHPRKEEIRFRDESFVYNTVIKAVREGLGLKATFLNPQSQELEFNIEGAQFWQLYDSYIFAETPDGILILDQHAAHERVMYNHILKEHIVPQKLLFPILVELTEVEQKLLQEYKAAFEELGFGIDEFGTGTYRVTSIPSVLQNFTQDLFKTMLLELAEYSQVSEDKMKDTIKMLACKSAIKAGKKLLPEEIEALTKSLFATDNPYFCPHGRPTIIKLTKTELEHRFGK
ncbi:MAG: DNA mismatch repair endonuclease MutL [Candidatus Stahlbacteria bacterium]|nr:DNA mismatch repair endonuclease MutL [Candidatus Stahlbacteria bacterium]